MSSAAGKSNLEAMSSPAGTMFSSLFREFSGAETGVFWDLDDCPIPNDLNPGSIYANIKSSLKDMGYSGGISIVAYSTRENINTEEFAAFNITLKQPDSLRAKLK
ncbi:PREDICTED: uncharacterized protein LOC104780412 [Camelina sativa]|uniref:Uncharacterized protein LOC104780412 n=1 Tax=Camelina sativa TaxID=90675 RepID=A0ABM0YMF3_CAMSA|nr:PREDICTED: uncharacterized protein LOC104780412 [Camelina sativa]